MIGFLSLVLVKNRPGSVDSSQKDKKENNPKSGLCWDVLICLANCDEINWSTCKS